ncbi:unnamed protein product [Adineta steineri]|uniref:Uncharacterized protein n=1 Tax=Adineta steineri TaxID=433720 RepID=A0A814K0B5_9BILA|nr:unnamed protein product [Adineta steineri]CAF1045806.1 unnamed protein product [Adineta steineri]CAF1079997.1 unnamed protein product [Adineta steineri]CAF3861307.1 unnamed protein product [Adineta steineri]CAF3941669.1 unnamed protein product [Adineta steineri]
MVSINEKSLLYAMMAITGLSTLFCLLGLGTPGWGRDGIHDLALGFFVFSPSIRKDNAAAGPLSIVSLLLLIGCLTVLGLIFKGKLKNHYVPVGTVILLIITTIFLLSTFASFFSTPYTYSVNLMTTAFVFTYLTSVIATYWLATIHGGLPHAKTKSGSHPSKINIGGGEPSGEF